MSQALPPNRLVNLYRGRGFSKLRALRWIVGIFGGSECQIEREAKAHARILISSVILLP